MSEAYKKIKLGEILNIPVLLRHPTAEEVAAEPDDFDPPTLVVQEFKLDGQGKRIALVEIDDLFDHQGYNFEK